VATVLGAGTMGAQIAAHLANAGCRVHLLDIVPKDVPKDAPAAKRNAIVLGAMKQMLKAKPPAYMSKAFAERITPGNLEDDLETACGESDLVIEAVIERLDIKQDLFGRVAKAAKDTTILASNTSGIPIGAIAEGMTGAARKRFVGLHFFNPPRWMHLLEVIPSKYTDLAVVEAAASFCDRTLGKGIVICRDTPNFIGNRIGIGEMLLTFKVTKDGGYTVEEVDVLNGPLMGRPKTGSYRLGDMVGLDVVGHVVRNLSETLSGDPKADNYDPLYDIMKVPESLEKMFEKNMLGDKTGGGFYKKTKDEKGKKAILALDLDTLEYRPKQDKPKFDDLKSIVKLPQLERKVNEALRAEGRAGEFLRKVYLPLFNYSAHLTGTICESPKQIDDAMCWGYGWQLGPFALMDAAGVKWCHDTMKQMDIAPAASIVELVEKHGDQARWYGEDKAAPDVYVPGQGREKIENPDGMIFLDQLSAAGAEIKANSSAALLDLGDGVACLQFRSKANFLDEGVVTLMNEAPQLLAEQGFRGLVIGNQEDHFCRGANLLQIGMYIMQKKWDDLENAVSALQDTVMNLRHGPLPVVVAPFGQTLGGGVEVALHGAQIQAGADLFMGLVEVAVGVLPAGGGLKEIARRASEWASQAPDTDPYPWIRRGFEAAATAKVSMSAFEARETGFLSVRDRITFHKSRVIADAKQACIGLAEGGWTPPDRNAPIQTIGSRGGSSLMLGVQQFEWGGYASEHDKLIGQKIINVLCGGMGLPKTVVAQDLLDLEREAFVSLCGTEKTIARIQHMLETRKPLRN